MDWREEKGTNTQMSCKDIRIFTLLVIGGHFLEIIFQNA